MWEICKSLLGRSRLQISHTCFPMLMKGLSSIPWYLITSSQSLGTWKFLIHNFYFYFFCGGFIRHTCFPMLMKDFSSIPWYLITWSESLGAWKFLYPYFFIFFYGGFIRSPFTLIRTFFLVVDSSPLINFFFQFWKECDSLSSSVI